MDNLNIDRVISILKKETKDYIVPIVTDVAGREDPFLVLISCILSLRTKDKTTAEASARLFRLAKTPKNMAKLTAKQIERAIYPVGFYITKAKRIRQISKELVENYHSKVPDDIDELLKFKGVGRKIANLVVTLGYGKPGICVDTHVHRISNRSGYVRTKNPFQTEMALRKKLPQRYWLVYNDLLVTWGQNVCKPISPLCSECPIKKYCGRVGVGKHR